MSQQNETCPVCINVYYKEGKKKKSEEDCTVENCEEKCVLGSDMCVTHNRQRYPIVCLSCNKSCCRLCYITIFLNAEEDATKCVHCNKQFDLEYLLGEDEKHKQRFSATFVWSDLKVHREKILVEQLMAKMPTYQRLAAAKNKANACSNKIREIDEQMRKLKNERNVVSNSMWEHNRIFNRMEERREEDKKENNFVTRGKCPKENCNGYIEDKWECGICQSKVCSQCMSEKLEGHQCNEDDIQSTKLIRDSTKPCPSCRTRIFRSEGCSQMWCTNCHVFFCWNSGKLIEKTQYVHNPHFIEFQRQNGIVGGGAAPNNNNGGCWQINVQSISNLGLDKAVERKLSVYIAKANHIIDHVQRYNDPIERKNRDISIQFLNGDITKEELAITIQKYDKASRKEELANLRRLTYGNTVKDIITLCHNEIRENSTAKKKMEIEKELLNKKEEEEEEECVPSVDMKEKVKKTIEKLNNTAIDTCLKRLENLDEYTKENMEVIGRLFKSNPPDVAMGFIENNYYRRW